MHYCAARITCTIAIGIVIAWREQRDVVPAVFLGVALLATDVPANRAARVDPMLARRQD